MSTRIYNFGRLSSPANSGTFSVDETSYTYSLSAVTWDTSGITPPIDQSDTSYWYASYSGYKNPYWSINFSASLPVYMLKISTSAPNPVTLRGYNGTSWVVITTFSGNLTLVLNGSVSYYGFKVDTTENGYTNIYNFYVYNFEVAFIFNTDPITVIGVESDDEIIGNQIITGNSGLSLDNPETITLGVNEVNILSGEVISDIEYFNLISRNFIGYEETNPFELANSAVNNKIGYFVDETKTGIRSRNHFNSLISDIEFGVRTRNIIGKNIDDIQISSQASIKYKLTVTPTHQHKSMPVTVNLSRRSTVDIFGKYDVTINDTVIIQPTSSDSLINNVEFTISPVQLTTGINKAKIKLFYPDGNQEYFDFEVVKEEPKRTVAQRLFRDYDGGFTGNSYAPPKILIPNIYPSWMATMGTSTSLMQTTDSTRMSLLGYTAVQGVSIVGNGLSILVSFDKGITWKSFINNAWATVNISDIANSGMSIATINSITIARWAEIFMPTSIDFAVYYRTPVVGVLYSGTRGPSNNLEFNNQYNIDTNRMSVTSVRIWGSSVVFADIYSNVYPNGKTINLSSYSDLSYIPVTNEVITKVICRTIGGGQGSGYYTISGIDRYSVYLKSITVNMTPNPFTGYAFII